MTAFVREVIKEAGALGLTRLERLLFIAVAAVAIVVAKVIGKKMGAAVANAVRNATPQQVADENGPQPDGVALPTDPDPPGDYGG